MLCKKCGAIVPEGSQYCQDCGNDVFAQTVVATPIEEKTVLEERTVVAYAQPANRQPEPTKKKNKGVIIGIVAVAIVAVAAIVVAVLFGTGVIGKEKEVENTITAHPPAKKTNQGETAIQIGNVVVTEGQFDYYYNMSYQYFAQLEVSYQQQGMSMGFPLDKAPDEVAYAKDDAGNDIMYDKAIADYAANLAYQQVSLYNEAKAAGYTLTAEEQTQIDDVILSLEEQAAANNYSLNAFIRKSYSKGLNEKGLRELLEIELLATRYNDDMQQAAYDSVTKEQVEAEYNANVVNYNYVDISYGYTNDLTATNIKTTIDNKYAGYSTLKESISEEAANWAFDSARKAGDKAIFTTNKMSYVVVVNKPSFAGNNADVRHCLVKFDGYGVSEPSDSQKKAAYEEALKIKEEWLRAGGTEEAFVEIVKKYTDDTASTEKGGLYEGITPTSNFVEGFQNWAIDPARKAGDCDIVETPYGYHVMYFVKNNGYDWETSALSKLQEEAYADAFEALMGENGKYTMVKNEKNIAKASEDFCKKIKENLAQQASQQTITF